MELEYEGQKRLFDYCMVFDKPERGLGMDSDIERPLVSMSDNETDIENLDDLARKDVSSAHKIEIVRHALLKAGLLIHESVSPDGGQLYYCISAPMRTLMNFAEANQILMHTTPECGTGMAPEPFIRSNHHRFHRISEPVFTPIQRQRLLLKVIKTAQDFGGAGIEVDDLKRYGLVKLFFPLHNTKAKDVLAKNWATFRAIHRKQKIGLVRDYFGEKVALYFAWLGFYTQVLVVPAIAGIALAVVEATTDKLGGGVIYTFVLVVWASLFVVLWHRREAELATDWQVDIEHDQEPLSDNFEGEWRTVDLQKLEFTYPLKVAVAKDGTVKEKYFSTAKRMLRIWLVSAPVLTLLIGSLLAVLIYITDWRFRPENPLNPTYASALTVTTMTVFNIVYGKICNKLNLFENYRTDTNAEDGMIRKSFIFQFCNAYSALFIIALWPKPGNRLEALSSQLFFILVVKPAIQNTQELLLPFIKNKVRYYADIRKDASLASRMTNIDLEANLEPYTTPLDDYLEITLQFGYMAMFAVAFPMGPAMALFWNMIEIRIDAVKLVQECQRPPAVAAKDMGAWAGIFKFLVIASALTNMYILCFLSEPFAEYGLNTKSDFSKALSFIGSQYVGFFTIAVIWLIVPSVPTKVLKLKACQEFYQGQQLLEQRKQQMTPLQELETPAAIKIQRRFRGVIARKRAQELRQHKPTGSSALLQPAQLSVSDAAEERQAAQEALREAEEEERHRAAELEAARRKRVEAERAAIRIQAGFRGMNARKQTSVLRSASQLKKEKEQLEMQKQQQQQAASPPAAAPTNGHEATHATEPERARVPSARHEPDTEQSPASPPSTTGGSYAPEDANDHFEGWLQKKGAGHLSGWKRRFFVLDSVYLSYYDTKGGREKGVFNVFQATVIDEKDNCFSVEGPYAKRRVHLQAASAMEKAEWVNRLWKAINSATESKTHDMFEAGNESD
eukprot:TRINITY_DN4459_c0_g2_i1.p1 TRINITY_DN4459_c0_g2~~TRINITY_DN4459_c0_g2_i1.p1  ORF type:complete len:973 (+),score=217.71 TRINITY_DN4459_c0_g2_i1:45-2921(+)